MKKIILILLLLSISICSFGCSQSSNELSNEESETTIETKDEIENEDEDDEEKDYPKSPITDEELENGKSCTAMGLSFIVPESYEGPHEVVSSRGTGYWGQKRISPEGSSDSVQVGYFYVDRAIEIPERFLGEITSTDEMELIKVERNVLQNVEESIFIWEKIKEGGKVILDSLVTISGPESMFVIYLKADTEEDIMKWLDTFDFEGYKPIESEDDDDEYDDDEYDEYDEFTNRYGTPTTICNASGCSNYIASSGDTWNCPEHSNICLECGNYCDGDAMYCGECLFG